jgi:putative transcriptional regulator
MESSHSTTPSPAQMRTTLRRLRRQKGLSQAALAERADLSREYVNKIEAGKYDPPLSTINAMAKALRVRLARLLE